MPKKLSTRPSKPRRGFCEDKDDVCEDTTHIAAMNKYTQRALTMRPRHVALPYYDEVKYDTNGKLIALPAEKTTVRHSSIPCHRTRHRRQKESLCQVAGRL
ncbi:hypothetical protein N7497_007333 [Penicillium chrysogenum]|nr:hypothetical protein N7497_007333 [Penicillium chrysogenum]